MQVSQLIKHDDNVDDDDNMNLMNIWMMVRSYLSPTLMMMMILFFSVPLLSVLRGHSVFPSPPQRPMTSDFEGFSIPDFIHYIYCPTIILEKEPVFPFLMLSAKQGNYWLFLKNYGRKNVMDKI